MKSKPQFSIVVPVYNVEKLLGECIQSILAQSFTDYEVILVDDGSPDQCPDICDEVSLQYPQIGVIHKTNGGVSSARFEGVKRAVGEYIVCVDADDWIAPDMLKKISGIIADCNPDIVCYGMNVDNGKTVIQHTIGERVGLYDRKNIEDILFVNLIQNDTAGYFSPSLCNKAIRRNLILDTFLVDRKANIGEDGACVIPAIYKSNSLYIMKESFYNYRFNANSATKSRSVFNWVWPVLVYDHIRRNIDENYGDFRDQLYRKLVHDCFNVAVSQFNSQEKYSITKKVIKENIRNAPYREAITNSRFKKFSKAWVMHFCLKHELVWLIYVMSKKR